MAESGNGRASDDRAQGGGDGRDGRDGGGQRTQSLPHGAMGSSAATEPAVFVIFGATGDLAKRKILPALFHLWRHDCTPKGVVVLGVSRDAHLRDEDFRALAREAVTGAERATPAEVDDWVNQYLFFQPSARGTEEDFTELRSRIERLERDFDYPQNRVFYLALPPGAFVNTVEAFGKLGLNRSAGWTRLVIEKPFGHDLESARELNRVVHRWFDESQIYRIDHYLGKETVQNLLVFRFANAMFETLWNRDHIESVMITVAEELGVEQRAGYYETAGALRDMVQSHLTQLLSLVAMEVPSALDANSIRSEKVKAVRAVATIDPDEVVFGQYVAGTVAGEDAAGYREEPGVAPDSRTETFVALRLELDNWRWQGVPFYLRTGKRMLRRLTEIEIKFRRAPVWMFRTVGAEDLRRNTLLLTLQPNEGFSLFFDVKAPGEPFRMRRLPLHFNYAQEFKAIPEAYQTLILDVLMGDQTLFVHADEVEASWALYESLLHDPTRPPVAPYPAGTWGPLEAAKFSSR
ncbi:MAG: glucose-6-phosphate dehydrogenase [Gemmatimonadaceae bacterium]